MISQKRLLMIVLFAAAGASPARAQTADQPFVVHGFVTQGIAAADSLPISGIPTTGTTDYRTVAIQARYRLDDKSSVVVQLHHKRVGTSPLADLEPVVEFDWAFYRRRMGPVALSVGRVPIPRGLYNEVRDAGTLLPFFRAPVWIYPDGTEAVDGAAATTRIDLGSWAVEANAYAGGMELKGARSNDQQVYTYGLRSERSFGTQLWLNTPITGVRTGVSYLNFEDETSATGRRVMWVGSAEVDRDRWMVRSEVTDASALGFDVLAGYIHGRFKITPRIHVMGQYEQSDFSATGPVAAEWTEMKDAALGVAFAPASNLVLKLEGHRAEGYGFDVPMSRFGPAAKSNYAILSMSVSF